MHPVLEMLRQEIASRLPVGWHTQAVHGEPNIFKVWCLATREPSLLGERLAVTLDGERLLVDPGGPIRLSDPSALSQLGARLGDRHVPLRYPLDQT